MENIVSKVEIEDETDVMRSRHNYDFKVGKQWGGYMNHDVEVDSEQSNHVGQAEKTEWWTRSKSTGKYGVDTNNDTNEVLKQKMQLASSIWIVLLAFF